MKFNLITNLDSPGLARDYSLLKEELLRLGHEVSPVQFKGVPRSESEMPHTIPVRADINVFLEIMVPGMLKLADQNWLIPNSEYWFPEHWDRWLWRIDKILLKTVEATRVWGERADASKLVYVEFCSRDMYDPSVKREIEFLHIAGKSTHKNTREVIDAWREFPMRYPLIILSSLPDHTRAAKGVPNVHVLSSVDEGKLKLLMNKCLYHLIPSECEGWGHAIREGLSTGNIILTTDAPPMNEVRGLLPNQLIPSYYKGQIRLAHTYGVYYEDIATKVRDCVDWPTPLLDTISVLERTAFHNQNEGFRKQLTKLVGGELPLPEAPTPIHISSIPPTKVALIGNFRPIHSTENELVWSLKDLGHTPILFQEDDATTDEILAGIGEAKLLIYVHTHGWLTRGTFDLDELWTRLRGKGCTPITFHLDRYWGLNLNDQREDLIGKHPMWHIDAWTADGGNQERFKERGVTHFWSPPAVVRRDCYLGTYREDFAIDVGFVGAVGYHPEYDWRGVLLNSLKQIYRERFRVFNGFRGRRLNDLYASIKVVVGDSCFAGSDFYTSDRIYETLGRGGMLIHPQTKGVNVPGLVTYQQGNLDELREKIDWFLAHEEERQACVKAASAWVKDNETYNNRLQKILEHYLHG